MFMFVLCACTVSVMVYTHTEIRKVKLDFAFFKFCAAKNVNIVLCVMYLGRSNHATVKHNMHCELFVVLLLRFVEEEVLYNNRVVCMFRTLMFVL